MIKSDTVVVLGSDTDCRLVRNILARTGWFDTKVAGDSLYGRRLRLSRLVVLDSFHEELQNPTVRQWVERDLLCRYHDADEAARKIGIEL